MIYGRHAVLEALRAGRPLEKIFILQTAGRGDNLDQIRRFAKEEGVPVLFAPREKLESLARTRDHQGVVAVPSETAYADLKEILNKKTSNRLLVLLDHVEDPQNLGSLLRTCDAVGVDAVVIPKRRSAGLSGGTSKASAGAIQYVPVARVSNLHQTILSLQEQGFTVIGADQAGQENFNEASYPDDLALVLGSEHEGLSHLIQKTCDKLIKIPMKGRLDSLNVSVSGALILYQIFLKRR